MTLQALQATVVRPATLDGMGLHTGSPTSVTFRPAPPGSGIIFIRSDLPGRPEIKADIDNVIGLDRGTTIGAGDARVHTVEHCLAALSGMGIDNCYVELDGPEPPVGDGSAMPFVEALTEAGKKEQEAPRRYLEVDEVITYSEAERGVDLLVLPSDRFRITFMVDYQNPALGTQYTSMYGLEEEFVEEFAAARTFCFLSEVKEMNDRGLIQGGDVHNAVVIIDHPIDDEAFEIMQDRFGIPPDAPREQGEVIVGGGFRWPNEPVRHKTLDLVGDFALLGMPLKGHVLAARSGHAANVAVVKKLRKFAERKEIELKYQGSKAEKGVLDHTALQRILPHRYPFLLVDRIVELVPRERVVGIKNVTLNEEFFTGHFPGQPVMPGVLIIEAMAQAGGVLLLNTFEDADDKLVYFMGIDGVRFRKPVVPGDQIRLEADLARLKGRTCKLLARAYVDGQLVAEGEFLASVQDRPPEPGTGEGEEEVPG
ncbi:MAG: bifunctional UDP-3-O-[3-hydroxymyristoyl] N-acetylglucosamine deacetylase/3-hydroxyacyl-ACP dehydratase [bacterium]